MTLRLPQGQCMVYSQAWECSYKWLVDSAWTKPLLDQLKLNQLASCAWLSMLIANEYIGLETQFR